VFAAFFSISLERFEVRFSAGQANFYILKKVDLGIIEDLKLRILELLPFRGVSAHFDLTDLN
jgi:hypothetical protein